jgi:hypothetical protein
MDPERLKQIPLFEGLSKKDRERVATWADEVDLESARASWNRASSLTSSSCWRRGAPT